MEIRKNWGRLLSLLIVVVLIYWAVNNILIIQNKAKLIKGKEAKLSYSFTIKKKIT